MLEMAKNMGPVVVSIPELLLFRRRIGCFDILIGGQTGHFFEGPEEGRFGSKARQLPDGFYGEGAVLCVQQLPPGLFHPILIDEIREAKAEKIINGLG